MRETGKTVRCRGREVSTGRMAPATTGVTSTAGNTEREGSTSLLATFTRVTGLRGSSTVRVRCVTRRGS